MNIASFAATRRPRTLLEILASGRELGETDGFLREFLDEFYLESDPVHRQRMIFEEPRLSGLRRVDAYLSAVAEHLAWRTGLTVPEWTSAKYRFLDKPFFPCGLESLKATLLVESPTAFRRRMIFVGADPLYRPRRETSGIGLPHRWMKAMHLAKDDILRGFQKLDAKARRAARFSSICRFMAEPRWPSPSTFAARPATWMPSFMEHRISCARPSSKSPRRKVGPRIGSTTV